MRALLCTEPGGIDALTLGDAPDPVAGPGEVVVDVAAAGLNFADTLITRGRYQVRPEMPFSPGFEGAGVLREVGDGVDLAVGTRVIGYATHGACAERWTVPATMTLPLPDELSFEEGAALGITYGTALYALQQQGRLRPGETLLVLGAAGGVGSAAVELGHVMGARVIAAAGSDEKLAFARELGADATIDYTTEDLKASVRELTGGGGADIVFDPVGGALSEPALRATAWDGRFLVIGFAAGSIPEIPLNLLLLKGVHVIGVFWGAWAERDPAAYAANAEQLLTMVRRGHVRPRVTQVFPLEEYAAAYRTLLGRTAKGKVVLRIRP